MYNSFFDDHCMTLNLVSKQKEVCWINPFKCSFSLTDALSQLVLSDADIDNAEKLFKRFAPFIKTAFPETQADDGIIESPLENIPKMKTSLEKLYNCTILGNLFLKMDSNLAVAGSVKARGGIYEVLKHAENLALSHGMITQSDDYSKFNQKEMKRFFNKYTIQVGSTGNLGLSIGIISASLGFKVIIHMSSDAKKWKKDMLRSKGVTVKEYDSNYSDAVKFGRYSSSKDPSSYFIDDEWSVDLFTGYAVAAKHLRTQLVKKGILVDKNRPLIVYIPAGVGGAPGGISYGLKRIFGDNVHCFFVEPVNYPSVLLGIGTQKFEKVKLSDYGISGATAADGLACPSPSGFVTRIMTNHLSGIFTVEDKKLFEYMKLLYNKENIKVEPSGCAAFKGAVTLLSDKNSVRYLSENSLNEQTLQNATQIVWATGGSLIPDDVFNEYLNTTL